MTRIVYSHSDTGWANALPAIEKIILSPGVRRVVEIGGGANPSFSLDFIRQHGIDYTLLDISQAELDKAPDGYNKVCVDICAAQVPVDADGYDFAFSRMLAEHVPDGRQFHKNVHTLLRNGGVAFHFFPTLFAFPFVLNYLIPEQLSEAVLHRIQPGRERSGKEGKFPAHYRWCRGPMKSQLRRLESLGYEVSEYAGFFGHGSYYRKLPLLQRLHEALVRFIGRHPIPSLTSYAQVLLKKPERAAA